MKKTKSHKCKKHNEYCYRIIMVNDDVNFSNNTIVENPVIYSATEYKSGDLIYLDQPKSTLDRWCVKVNWINKNIDTGVIYLHCSKYSLLGVIDELNCTEYYFSKMVWKVWNTKKTNVENYKEIFNFMRNRGMLFSDDFNDFVRLLKKYLTMYFANDSFWQNEDTEGLTVVL